MLEADRGHEALVLEMAMRGEGQIAELAEIAEPDVGVIVNVGPVHLELLGTVERVAAAKAELIRDLPAGAACVVPASEPLLDAHLRDDLDTWTFGPGGQVMLLSYSAGRAEIEARGRALELELPFDEPHNLLNTLAAVAAARGDRRAPERPRRGGVLLAPGRGGGAARGRDGRERLLQRQPDVDAGGTRTPGPEPRRAAPGRARDDGRAGRARRPGFHRQIGEEAAGLGIDVLVTVGEEALGYAEGFDGETYSVGTPEEAGALLEEVALPGDRVLVKGSRSVGLERVLA